MSKGHGPRRYNVARYDRNRARIRWKRDKETVQGAFFPCGTPRFKGTVVDEIEALIDEAGIGGKRKDGK